MGPCERAPISCWWIADWPRAASRAQALILAGKVFSGERRIAKAGDTLSPDAALEVRGHDHPWVSRGGLKLDHALRHFGLSPAGRICLDIGASTGGFTDVLLAHGAAKVHAVDVGHGQLAWKLRNDPRVVVHERTNARYLTREIIADPIAALVCDASFIGLATVLPAALALCAPGAWAVALIKPQFEAGPDAVGSKGVVRDPAVHTGGVRAHRCLVGCAAGLARAGHHRKPDHRTGRQPRVPDRRGEGLSVRPGSFGVTARHVLLRDLGQQRPHLRGFHRHVRIVQQTIEFVQFPGVLGLRHFPLPSRVSQAKQPQEHGAPGARIWR